MSHSTININGTDIYIASIGDLDNLIAKATPEHLQLIDFINSPRRKAEILATRQLVCEILSPTATIGHNPDGSPNIIGSNLNISISHSHNHVAIALNPHQRIGIDIESWRDSLNIVREKFLTTHEIAVYNSPQLLLQAWTSKEAIYKAAGITGLPFHNILLPLDTTKNIATVTHNSLNINFELHTLTHTNYTLTLAQKIK